MKPAVVHPSQVQRWLEQLCRFRHNPLGSLADVQGRLNLDLIPADAGVYAFWWTGSLELLHDRACSRTVIVKGPAGRDITIHFDDEWLGTAAGAAVPLYVGKSAAGMRERIRQHLLFARSRILPMSSSLAKAKRPTSSCQLRAGIDQLFPKSEDTRPIIRENVSLSYVELPGDEHAANRFYLEDLAIGLMRPPLNVDVER